MLVIPLFSGELSLWLSLKIHLKKNTSANRNLFHLDYDIKATVFQ